MEMRIRRDPLLNTVLLGLWIMVYIWMAILALEDLFPELARIFPPFRTALTLGLLPIR